MAPPQTEMLLTFLLQGCAQAVWRTKYRAFDWLETMWHKLLVVPAVQSTWPISSEL